MYRKRSLFLFLLCFAFYDSKGGGRRDQRCYENEKIRIFIFLFKPVEILEYRLVPLMISVVNIGEDLSASALTRCLGYKKSRTNISRCGFGWVDYALFVLGIGFILLYFLELGGVI